MFLYFLHFREKNFLINAMFFLERNARHNEIGPPVDRRKLVQVFPYYLFDEC